LVATKNGEFWKLDKNPGIKNKFYKIMHDNTFFENIIPDFIDKSPITTILENIYVISSSKIYHIEDIKEYDWNSKEGEVLLVKEELKHKIMPFEDIVDSPAITTSENLLVVSRSDKKSKILCIDSLCIDSNQVLWEYNCSEKISYSPVVADY
jgi:hypothetical protein